jgi:hypothetical protein
MSSPQEPPAVSGTAVVGRCPTCGARLRARDQWCTLCLTPVPPPSALLAPEPAPEPPAATGAGAEARGDDDAERAADAAAARLLEELRMRETHRLPPRLAAIRPRTKAAEAMLAGLGGLVMIGVLFGTLYVVGRFL